MHPEYAASTGIFTLSPVQFTAAGPYRLYADFATTNTPLSDDATKVRSTPYTDAIVGNQKNYIAADTLGTNFTSTSNNFDANIFFSGGDSVGAPRTSFNAGTINTVAVSINQGGKAFTQLQNYKGSLGRLAAFGPHLGMYPLMRNLQTSLNKVVWYYLISHLVHQGFTDCMCKQSQMM